MSIIFIVFSIILFLVYIIKDKAVTYLVYRQKKRKKSILKNKKNNADNYILNCLFGRIETLFYMIEYKWLIMLAVLLVNIFSVILVSKNASNFLMKIIFLLFVNIACYKAFLIISFLIEKWQCVSFLESFEHAYLLEGDLQAAIVKCNLYTDSRLVDLNVKKHVDRLFEKDILTKEKASVGLIELLLSDIYKNGEKMRVLSNIKNILKRIRGDFEKTKDSIMNVSVYAVLILLMPMLKKFGESMDLASLMNNQSNSVLDDTCLYCISLVFVMILFSFAMRNV